nr:S53 family peptidase [Polymorphobacter sp.]
MSDTRVDLPGSHRTAPAAEHVGPTAPDEPIEVSVYLKDREGDPLLALPPVTEPAALTGASASRANLNEQRHAESRGDIDCVVAFAKAHGLTVVAEHVARRLVTLRGTAAKIEAAFGTQLAEYDNGTIRFRARSGALTLPADVAAAVTAVLGLDTRPIATPKLRIATPNATSGFLPNAVGAVYGFPAGATAGAGQTIAIVELGGGFLDSDTKAAFAAMKLPVPKVSAVGVSGGSNAPTTDPNANGEVALDIQVAGGVAPGAAMAVYFAPNTSQGFVDAISTAVHDTTHKPSVISISWGSAEANWTQQALDAMTAALKDAATLGVTVFAASGDGLATDGVSDGKAHVDFPASSPYVVGCGGTLLHATGGKRGSERVWNSNGGGTGGGVSASFARPAYQSAVRVPAAPVARGGRGVPDVAGDADPSSGYRVVVGGAAQQIGGTSAVAPLWAGLIAAINAQAKHPVGFIHPLLYGNEARFNDIVTGNNKDKAIGFSAAKGWDPCTGLGTPIGSALLALFTG